MSKQHKKQEHGKFNHLAGKFIQRVVLNARHENVVRAFLMGTDAPRVTFEQVHIHNANPPYHEVHIGTYHAGFQEYSIKPNVVSACAILGVRAADILKVLLAMDYEGQHVVSVDYNEIVSPAVTHLAAVCGAVSIVMDQPEILGTL